MRKILSDIFLSKYKKLFIPLLAGILLCLPLTSAGQSQNALIPKGGLTYNFLGVGFEDGFRDRFAYTLGLAGIIRVGNNLVVKPEFAFSRRSIDLFRPVYIDDDYSDSDVRLGLNYLDFSAHFGWGGFFEPDAPNGGTSVNLLVFYAGPQVSILNSQDNRLISGSEQVAIPEVDRIRNYNIGMNAGFTFGFSGFTIDARYFIPFNSFMQLDTYGDVLQTMNLTIGYTIWTW